jgi:hypothetical protein
MRVVLFVGAVAALSMGLAAFLSIKAVKGKPGPQPRAQNFAYMLLFMAVTAVCGWLLHRFGLDILKPPANGRFWIILGATYWCGIATQFWQRRHAGALLLDRSRLRPECLSSLLPS